MHNRLQGGDSTTPTLMELQRLDTERRLRSMPRTMSESSWAIEAQREAIIDALLAATTHGDERTYAHARHVGEWCARIAAQLPEAPEPAFMRRCGVLAHVDPDVLERLPLVQDCAELVRAFQGSNEIGIAVTILAVADEFDRLIFASGEQERLLPAEALRTLTQAADARRRPIVGALMRALHASPKAVGAVAPRGVTGTRAAAFG